MIADNNDKGLVVILIPMYENIDGEDRPCADICVSYKGEKISLKDTDYTYYFDDKFVRNFKDISDISEDVHEFKIVVVYKGITKIAIANKRYRRNKLITSNRDKL